VKAYKNIEISESIVSLEMIDSDHFGVIDSANIYRVYNIKTFDRVSGFKSNVEAATDYREKSVISPDGSCIAFYSESKKEIYLFDTHKKAFIHKIHPHQTGLESLRFSKDSTYLISGGMDGRVYLWCAKSGKKLDTLASHADSVHVVALSDNGRWSATAGHDNIIRVSNRSFHGMHYRLISHKSVPTTLTFISAQRIVSTDRDGVVLIWDIQTSKVINRLESFKSEIRTSTLSKDGKYLIVCGIHGEVGLYNLEEAILLKRDFLKHTSGVNRVLYSLDHHSFIFGLDDGTITIYNLQREEQSLKELFQKHQYSECYIMTKDNPLLRDALHFKKLEALFDVYYKKARQLLAKNQKVNAQNVLDYFSATKEKRLIIQKLFSDFSFYPQLKNAYAAQKLVMAYTMVEKYSELEYTSEYRGMEKRWVKTLKVVQSIEDDKNYDEKISALFKPYKGIASKNGIVKALHDDRNIFKIFLHAIEKKEYYTAFNVVENHQFLKGLPEYKRLLSIGDIYEENIHNAFNSGEYHQAVKFCDIVSYFPGKKEFAGNIKGRANI